MEYVEPLGRMLAELAEVNARHELAGGLWGGTIPLLSRALLDAGRSALSEARGWAAEAERLDPDGDGGAK